ncbi:MAG: EamA family transporter [Rubrivivax sp.]|nr:EamA family transporter [Rubrivivax sp.]
MTPAISPLRGVALVLGAALLWGTTGTAQSLAPAQLSSYWVGALRLVASGVFFAAWLAATERRALAPAALGGLPWRGITLAAVCMSAYNLAFFAGVRASGVAVGTAIALGSGPVWAGVLQAVMQRRPPSATWWAGTALAVGGGALMIAGGSHTLPFTPLGVGLCLLAGLSYAVYALVNQGLVSGASAGAVTGAVFSGAALLALPVAGALAGPPLLQTSDLVIVAWLGVMSTGVAYLLFSHALRHISGATAVALALAEPVTAFALAVLIVGERPGMWALLGLLAVLAGLAVVIRAELRRP